MLPDRRSGVAVGFAGHHQSPAIHASWFSHASRTSSHFMFGFKTVPQTPVKFTVILRQ
jgi:hypothetical protein